MRDGDYFMRAVGSVCEPKIVICKSKRVLELYDGGELIARVPVAFGSAEGHKTREGDLKTPEGCYTVCVRNEKSKYHLALGISYPNADDARRGLETGLISADQCDAIVDANRRRIRPPWDTGLGGEIMIHGGGSATDWTAGCVALDDDRIEYLWPLVRIGLFPNFRFSAIIIQCIRFYMINIGET